jgi:hypothetical protein
MFRYIQEVVSNSRQFLQGAQSIRELLNFMWVGPDFGLFKT